MYEVISEDVDPNLFSPINYSKLPSLFIGFIIKNTLDYDNITCNEDVNDLAHLCGSNNQIEPVFLRGKIYNGNHICQRLIKEVNNISSIDTDVIYSKYVDILKKFYLSCRNSFAYNMDGLYPIDIVHISSITDNSYQYYENDILDREKTPWYLAAELKALILTKSNLYIYKNT